jgi:pyruvate carboxylase subunit B
MELPPGCEGAHDAEFYTKTLRDILDADLPFDSVCFKDASGTSVPSKVYETIKAARKMLPEDVSIHFHSHETAGIGVIGYKAALDAGADAIDLSMAPASGGTCQPDIIVMWHALRGTDYDLDVDIDKVREAEAVFKDCMSDYFLPPEATAVEPNIPWSPMPGGALTANTQMLRDNGIMDKYPEIIDAMGEVVRKGGFGTSVTPVSQFYFQQAFNNVMFGPWQNIAEGYGKMVLGYFGKTPVAPDADIVKLCSEKLGLEPTTKPVLEINDADPTKGRAPAVKLLKDAGLEETEENVFIASTCKDKGIAFLKGEAKLGIRLKEKEAPAGGATKAASYAVTVNGKVYNVAMGDGAATVNGKNYTIDVNEGGAASAAAAPAAGGPKTDITAQMPGVIIRVEVGVGDVVVEGDVVLVMEAMKMEVEVKAPAAGTVAEVAVAVGDQVQSAGLLVTLS